MKTAFHSLTPHQRIFAIQRLTALWAFTESGLGGIMHAFQMPFTGLVVGGMAVIIISMIAEIGANRYKQILTSAFVVLIVKGIVSPYTPFTAYIAVSFQAFLGYALFNLCRVNFLSILLLCVIAMIESALQKLLVLTLFFGTSLWKASDKMMTFIAGQFGITSTNGSFWIISIYLLLYLVAGFFIAWFAYRILRSYNNDIVVNHLETITISNYSEKAKKRKNLKKIWLLFFTMICLSVFLYYFSSDTKQGWVEVGKTITWTLSAILIWFMLLGPLVSGVIKKILHKKESKYSAEILSILSFLPVLKILSGIVWRQSKTYKGFKRWTFFISSLINVTLTYSEPLNKKKSDSIA